MTKRERLRTSRGNPHDQTSDEKEMLTVFISHYTKDGELAQAFATMLSRVFSEQVRVFRSSDRVNGIPYGRAWFDSLTSEIRRASAMVCLLTTRSVERPWVFWEAGVAFGRGIPVFGLAVGLPVDDARVGPFAPFQICDDALPSLTALMKSVLKDLKKTASDFLIEQAVRKFLGYKGHVLSRIRARPKVDYLKPSAEVAVTLKQMQHRFFAVDGMIEICRSVGYSGWARNDMALPRIIGQRKLPDDFMAYKGRDARCEGGSQARYSLRSITEPLLDSGRSTIVTVLARSSYADLFRLSRLIDKRFTWKPGEIRTGRDLHGLTWYPLEKSRLVHNVNTQPIIITRDRRIVLAKRSPMVHHYPGLWSASIEEQMMAPGDTLSKPDSTYFECAERGVREELAGSPNPAATRVLSVGIEHANLSASFICLTRIEESFDELCQNWMAKAQDLYELAAIDSLPLTRRAIELALKESHHTPSRGVCIRTDGDEAGWHPTARMRLYSLMCHLDEREEDIFTEPSRTRA